MKTLIPFRASQVASGSGLPAANELVTLFDSTVAFGPKTMQRMGENYWYTYSICPSTNATGNSVTGQFSVDGGVVWTTFYTSTTDEPVGDGTVFTDEVFIGHYEDVRFRFQNGAAAQATKFVVAQSIDDYQRGTAGV